MFGIGLPEMILILALALIVVGPDKLPELARSVAKGILELKKTAEALKQNLTEDGNNPLDILKPEIDNVTNSVRNNLLEAGPAEQEWKTREPGSGVNPAPDTKPIIEAEITPLDEPAQRQAMTAQTDSSSESGESKTVSPSSTTPTT